MMLENQCYYLSSLLQLKYRLKYAAEFHPPRNTRVTFPNFQNRECCKKKLKDNINGMASIWGENMLGYFSLDIVCSSKLTVSRKTVCFPEQTMSVDKHPSIFLRQIEDIVYWLLCHVV